MLETAITWAREAGELLLRHRHRLTAVHTKESPASVVTEADLAAERYLFERIRARFPHDGFLGEETGFHPGRSGRVWVVDPLDGTSNYVAGLPWFGVMLAAIEHGEPQLAVMRLPALDELYTAATGAGAFCNGRPVRVSAETDLAQVLVAFGLDGTADTVALHRQGLMLAAVAQRVRNLRATNSLVDFAGTADGRFGGAVNFACKLWDLAAPALVIREAGGRVTDLAGQPLAWSFEAGTWSRTYAVVAAAPALHAPLCTVLASADKAP